MKIKAWFGGQAWTFEFVPAVIDNDDTVCYGITDKDQFTVKIATKYPRQQQQSAVIHELSHVFLSDTSHPTEVEPCIRVQESGWRELFNDRRNSKLLDFILDEPTQ